MSFLDVLFVVVVPIVTTTLAILYGFVLPRSRRKKRLHGPVTFSLDTNFEYLPPRPVRQTPPSVNASSQPPHITETASPRSTAAEAPLQVASTGTDNVRPVEGRAAESRTVDLRAVDAPRLRLETSAEDAPARSSPRRQRSVEGTLQFLPGRLEIIEGRDVGQEVRFVRQPGEDGTTVTFGRNDGQAYRHVQLHEPTVSRLHAKMTLEGRRWRLHNLSATNPVVVNGAPLEGEGASAVLSEGDRVEMGEVVFRFRSK